MSIQPVTPRDLSFKDRCTYIDNLFQDYYREHGTDDCKPEFLILQGRIWRLANQRPSDTSCMNILGLINWRAQTHTRTLGRRNPRRLHARRRRLQGSPTRPPGQPRTNHHRTHPTTHTQRKEVNCLGSKLTTRSIVIRRLWNYPSKPWGCGRLLGRGAPTI